MNRLAYETSPYLLQHAANPVDWYPWGEEAFQRARDEDKPILLSVGYSACHWCHVMERESFEDDATAQLMNERFVSVKVDREERPDVDAVYMSAVVALSGQGGWPMTVFLTPQGEPFFGGTYYPPEPRHGMPAFGQVLNALADAYRDQRDDVAQQAAALVDALRRNARTEPSNDALTDELPDEAVRVLRTQYDSRWGGFGRAPKFPPASTIEFLLRRGVFDMALGTLDGMRAGGMYDVVGGGFHRYSVDGQWLVPHFEKMLYDNALLVPAYLHAYLLTGENSYRAIVEETVDYVLRELRLDGGGFASAQDADTNGVEGLTFTWEPHEVARNELLQPFEHGRFIIRGRLTAEERASLLAVRRSRPQPLRDDKAIASWNGLMLAALAESGQRLDRADWIDAARGLGEFLLGPLSDGGRLHRTWREGVAKGNGYLENVIANPLETTISRTTRTSRTACTSSTSRPASCTGSTSRAGSRCSRSTSSPTARAPASSSRLATVRRSSPARKISTTTRRPPVTRCSRSSCFGSRGCGATRSSSAGPSTCCGSSATPFRERRRHSDGLFAHSICTFRGRARSR